MARVHLALTIFLMALFCAAPCRAQDQRSNPPPKDDVKTAGRDGVGVPQCTYCPPAEYSDKGRKAKIQGTVALSIVVDTDGSVRDATVTKPLGYGLDESAVKTVKKWRFKPAVDRDGDPVPVKVAVQVSFHLY